MPRVRLTQGNLTSDSLERSLARSDISSLADVPLSSELQVYKIIIISSSYYWSFHDRSYIIIRENNPTSPVLTLVHAKSWLTRVKSRLTRSMSQLTRANEYIKNNILYGRKTDKNEPSYSFQKIIFSKCTYIWGRQQGKESRILDFSPKLSTYTRVHIILPDLYCTC